MSSPDEELNQQIKNKFIRDTVRPFESKSRIQFEENSIPTYKVEKHPMPQPPQPQMMEPPKSLSFTPINSTNHNSFHSHNCIETFDCVRSCPICKHLYSKNDGIYVCVIIILVIIIILLLKSIYQKK